MSQRGGLGRGRQRLGDITNMDLKEEMYGKSVVEREKTNLVTPASTMEGSQLPSEQDKPNIFPAVNRKGYSQLLQENAALSRLLRARNQIIQYSNLELHELQMALQQTLLQNSQLAQAHSQMLVELNNGKDRLKLLQHELACTLAVLKAKDIKQEEMQPMKCTGVIRADELLLSSSKNPCITDGKCASGDCASGSSAFTQQAAEKEKDDNKRRFTRRFLRNSFEPQICDPKHPTNTNKSVNENQPVQLVSLTNPNSTNVSQDGIKRTCIMSGAFGSTMNSQAAEKEKNNNRRRSTRRSTRRQSITNHDDPAAEYQPVEFVSILDTDQKTVPNEGKKQVGNRKISIVSAALCSTSTLQAAQKVKDHNIRRSMRQSFCNTEPQIWKPSNPINSNNSTTEDQSAQLLSLAEKTSIINNTEKTGKPRKRKFSAPSHSKELPILPAGRPSRRATIGVSYKELPLNIKMRRNV